MHPEESPIEQPMDCPEEIAVPDPVSVEDLANLLGCKWDRVVAVLAQLGIFKSTADVLDYQTASLVCRYWRISPKRLP